MDRTKIEWADSSWNPIRARNRDTGKVGWFCTHASPGCGDHTGGGCYAEAINRRLGTGVDYRAQDLAKVEIFLDEKMLTQPLRWRRPRRIFVGSMTDLFGEFVPDEMLDRIFAVMALCPQHTFLVLTKRAQRMRGYLYGKKLQLQVRWGTAARQIDPRAAQKINLPFPLPQISLGVSVEDQRRADERIPELLATPAAVRWVSYEPALELVSLTRFLPHDDCDEAHPHDIGYCWALGGGEPRIEAGSPLDWVVCGGESGPHARPMLASWARAVRDQCTAAGVPFFFKQWGEWAPVIDRDGSTRSEGDGRHRGATWLDDCWAEFAPGTKHCDTYRVGKRAAGRLLDGRLWDEYPERGDV